MPGRKRAYLTDFVRACIGRVDDDSIVLGKGIGVVCDRKPCGQRRERKKRENEAVGGTPHLELL